MKILRLKIKGSTTSGKNVQRWSVNGIKIYELVCEPEKVGNRWYTESNF